MISEYGADTVAGLHMVNNPQTLWSFCSILHLKQY
jgi:hypothetical protein